jgi:hypothetical protein
MPVGIGDTVPLIHDKNGRRIVISPSIVKEGDTVMMLRDNSGNYIIVDNGAISVGDTVIVAPVRK